jgi:MFS family permease
MPAAPDQASGAEGAPGPRAGAPGPPGGAPGPPGPGRTRRLLEPWFAPFGLINGAAVGLAPILLPVVAVRYGIGHVGLVMGAFNLGAFAAPLSGALADRYHAYRLLAIACAAVSAVSLWLFPLAGAPLQLLLALANGGAFAGAVTVADLLIVERRPQPEWNQRLGWLETVLSLGQGGALILAAWLSGLTARTGLLIAALVPAAAVPLAALLIPRVTGTKPVIPNAPAPAASPPDAPGGPAARAGHHLASVGHVGEWGPASPSRIHDLHQQRRPFDGVRSAVALMRGGLGWMLAAWIPAYAGTAIIFALYPVLFSRAFGVAPQASALAFAVIVLVSLPLFIVAGKACGRRGPVVVIVGSLAARVVLLAALAAFAAVGHIPAVVPLAAFAGIMFAWSFLSVASPALTGQLCPKSAEGDAQGALNAASGLAGLIGSVVGGLVAASFGYPAALALGAAAVLAGLTVFAVTFLRARHRSSTPAPAPAAPVPARPSTSPATPAPSAATGPESAAP